MSTLCQMGGHDCEDNNDDYGDDFCNNDVDDVND